MTAPDKIAKMPIPERVSMAKEKTRRVVDHLMYLLELHENNAIVLYSPTLSAQIPTSFAANAFNVFQRGLHQFEIVRLCALWDSVDLDKENVPTVIELIDHPDVIESLAEETAAPWQGIGGRLLNPSDDPELKSLEIDLVQQANEGFGQKQAEKARCDLRKAIDDSRFILASPKHASIMNLRDKHLAHSLSETRRERKAGPVAPMKYGDEREVLNATLPIAEALYCWVNGTSFSFDDSRKIDRKNAAALWGACSFNIQNTGALRSPSGQSAAEQAALRP
jgi:AbiU2